MRDFREVGAWPKAHAWVLQIYRETKALPREEMLGVTMLIWRSATAIATRIAEGSVRERSIEFAADLRRAISSCNELEYLLLLAKDLNLWKAALSDELMSDTIEVRKMIFGLLRSL
jgi:four helix bundle protein